VDVQVTSDNSLAYVVTTKPCKNSFVWTAVHSDIFKAPNEYHVIIWWYT
jgi:hypothetical protein